MRRGLLLAVLLALASSPARAHPYTEEQTYRSALHLGHLIPSEVSCRYLRKINVGCFDLDGHQTAVSIIFDDRTTKTPISGMAEFRIGGVWSGYASARMFCGDGKRTLAVPAGATAMLVRASTPGVDPTFCTRGVGVPVNGTIVAQFL